MRSMIESADRNETNNETGKPNLALQAILSAKLNGCKGLANKFSRGIIVCFQISKNISVN